MRLDSNLWMVHVMVSDIPSAMDTARHLRDSPEALHQAHGWMTVAFHVGVLDPDRGSQILERAHDALQVVAAGPDRVLATGYYEHISSLIALHRNDLQEAFDHGRAAVSLFSKLGFVSQAFAQAATTLAVSALMIGNPVAALEAVELYSHTMPVNGTGDEIRALAFTALGDFDQAYSLAREVALEAISGRIDSLATDALLVLSSLDAESKLNSMPPRRPFPPSPVPLERMTGRISLSKSNGEDGCEALAIRLAGITQILAGGIESEVLPCNDGGMGSRTR
jgi:hypothetical protein